MRRGSGRDKGVVQTLSSLGVGADGLGADLHDLDRLLGATGFWV